VAQVKQEVLTLPEQLISHQVFMGFVLLNLMFSVYGSVSCANVCLFVIFVLTIILSVFPRDF
jgi:hypothetical protein